MKTHKTMKPTLLLGLVLLGANTFAQLSSKHIDSLMQNAIRKFNVAGAAIAIVKDGKVIQF
jgi:hypothetical protein